MAVFGYLDEIVNNLPLDKAILKGIAYLRELTPETFLGLTEGRAETIVIDPDTLFANNQRYRTKPRNQARFEGHRRYIDLQFVVDGCETLLTGSITDCRKETDYDAENDVQFFTTDLFSSIALKKNMLCILYPDDIHAPGLV